MSNAVTLTDDQIAFYREHGYVMLGRVLDDQNLEELRAEEARFRQHAQISLADWKTPLPDSSTIFRNQLANYSASIRGLLLDGPHVDAIAQLIGPLVCGAFTQFVTRAWDTSLATGQFPWHQDNGYGDKRSPNHVTIWCALDDVDERNGCVWVVPGSQNRGLLPHHAAGSSWHVTVDEASDGVAATMPAGHAVAFTGLTLHRSLANHTDQPRRAFFMEYTDYVSDMADPNALYTAPLWIARGSLPYPKIA